MKKDRRKRLYTINLKARKTDHLLKINEKKSSSKKELIALSQIHEKISPSLMLESIEERRRKGRVEIRLENHDSLKSPLH
jgi:hypothetical protein